MKIDDGVGCRQAKVSEKMEAAFERRQKKGIEIMNNGVEGCQAARSEKMESKVVRQGRSEKMESKAVRPGESRQEDWLGGAWKSIRRRRWSGHVLANKTYLFVL